MSTEQTKLALKKKCCEYGKLLGINEPVSEDVLLASLEEENYANNLLLYRKIPLLLDFLLSNPPQVKNHHKDETIIQSNNRAQSNLKLISKATIAIARWGKVGFIIVDSNTIERRENACLACPNLSNPEKTIQKIIPSKKIKDIIGGRTGSKVCQKCGCNVSLKIRIPSESCPDKFPGEPAISRWRESII